jgi:hypothetical protein
MKVFTYTIAALILSAASFADTGSGYQRLQEGVKTYVRLDHCQGYAQLSETRIGGRRLPVVQFRNVTSCSKISIDGVRQSEKIGRSGQNGYADIVVYETPGRNVHFITLQSGSGRTSDTVEVVSYGNYEQPAPPQQRANVVLDFGYLGSAFGVEKSANLFDCGGTVTAKVIEAQQLNLVFRDLESCSKFDILSADGYSVDYDTKSLQRSRRGGFSGSFTIPKRFIDAGRNAIKVVVKSNTGRHDDVILVRFTAY